ncbi:MAG TPA: hypothetical protein VKU84_16935 [Stellaceae bacterium]|nr:hypothetical protein [Stellaceae bacterium]
MDNISEEKPVHDVHGQPLNPGCKVKHVAPDGWHRLGANIATVAVVEYPVCILDLPEEIIQDRFRSLRTRRRTMRPQYPVSTVYLGELLVAV